MPIIQDFIPLDTNTSVNQPAQSHINIFEAEVLNILSLPEDTQPNVERRYPDRERRAPAKYEDFVKCVTVDYCYNLSAIPRNYKEAMSSQEAPKWKQSMDKEFTSLTETY